MTEEPKTLKPIIAELALGKTLNVEEARIAFDIMMSGDATPAQMGGLLMALRVRGETVDEITGGIMTAAEWRANLWRTIKSGWYAFLVPGIIFYGIFSGRLTPTEAGAVAVVVTIAMGFILGTLKLSDFPAMLVSSAKVNGVILPIIAFSIPLAEALAIIGVPQGFVGALTSLSDNEYVLIGMMVLILIAAGCVMETTPNIVILAPILKPLADNIGMNEVQFCIMMITALGVGFITPPLGLNLFVVSGITGEAILRIANRAIPFVFFMLIVTLLIAYVPAISTTLLPELYR